MTDLVLTPEITPLNVGNLSFDEVQMYCAGGAYSIPGASIVPKGHLCGVPFIITGITFQHVEKRYGAKEATDFVSVEGTVAGPEKLTRELARGRISMFDEPTRTAVIPANLDGVLVDPNERIIFNDGSTGIRRQLATMLDAYGIVKVGHGADINTNREAYDLPWNQWEEFPVDCIRETGEGAELKRALRIERNHAGGILAIQVLRGLQPSVYNEGESLTFYLR